VYRRCRCISGVVDVLAKFFVWMVKEYAGVRDADVSGTIEG